MAAQYVGTQSFFICREKRNIPSYFRLGVNTALATMVSLIEIIRGEWFQISCGVRWLQSGVPTHKPVDAWELISVSLSSHSESSVWIPAHKTFWAWKAAGNEIRTQHGYRRINLRSELMRNRIPAVKVADPSISCLKIIHTVLQNKIWVRDKYSLTL